MPSNHILYPALKLILVNRLQKALYYSQNVWQPVELTSLVPTSHTTSLSTCLHNLSNPSSLSHSSPNSSEIPVNRVKRDDQVWYISPIALKLTLTNARFTHHQQSSRQKTIDLAEKIADLLNRDTIAAAIATDLPPLDRIGQNFVAETDPSGWIHFNLRAAGLHEWLKVLCDRLPTFVLQNHELPIVGWSKGIPDRYHQTSFAVLHTYARCCSLLRLGLQEQIVQLDLLNPELAVWILKNPGTIAWLNADRQLYCTHPTEQFLIAQIINVLDELGCNTTSLASQRLWKFAQQLSQSFQQFDAGCRIFGATQTTDRALAQARLGLVLITQALLNWILRSRLYLSPPIAL